MIRLGYPDRIVYIRDGKVYVFKKKLYWADLSDVLRAVYESELPLPDVFFEVAKDVAEVVEKLGDHSETYYPVAQGNPAY
jgi:hypothetical protein